MPIEDTIRVFLLCVTGCLLVNKIWEMNFMFAG